MIRCADCKYWGAKESGYSHPPLIRLCTQITTEDGAASVYDMEGNGELLTVGMFGCLLGEARND